MAEQTHRMRLDFLDGARPVTLDGLDRSSRSRPDDLIQADLVKNIWVGSGLSGSWDPPVRAALERDGMPNLVRTLEFGAEHPAPRRFGL